MGISNPPKGTLGRSRLQATSRTTSSREELEAACKRALLSHREMPTPTVAAELVTHLTEHGAALTAALRAKGPDSLTEGSVVALRDWDALTKGPGAGAFGTWIHLRALARVCLALLHHTEPAPDLLSEWMTR
ncbi:DUF6415 family natural product biosynthesis protein [Streptomyces sp. BBFR2]|uniref:DUF6415 family natural product biosynthesis protein n=1 Tax=Streptomyces sp. BBFR2 TaxID=3372854 RepID=UPI0037D9C06D